MIHKLRRFLRLPRADQWLLLQSVPMLLLVDLGLRLWGYKTMHKRWVRIKTQNNVAPHPIAQAHYLAAIIQTANSVLHRTCLVRSLVLARLLSRKGIASEIVFGVNKESEDVIRAHAWVEIDGVKINEPEMVNELFTPLYNPRVSP